eukprot:3937228-Rhodomonas_salina.2
MEGERGTGIQRVRERGSNRDGPQRCRLRRRLEPGSELQPAPLASPGSPPHTEVMAYELEALLEVPVEVLHGRAKKRGRDTRQKELHE